jgi:hypothetical protein
MRLLPVRTEPRRERRSAPHEQPPLRLAEVAGVMGGTMSQARVWTVEIAFSEDESHTRADARLRTGEREMAGWGRSRRNPADPDVPAIGEELAAARALSDLTHQLVHAAADAIEVFEGHPVDLVG